MFTFKIAVNRLCSINVLERVVKMAVRNYMASEYSCVFLAVWNVKCICLLSSVIIVRTQFKTPASSKTEKTRHFECQIYVYSILNWIEHTSSSSSIQIYTSLFMDFAIFFLEIVKLYSFARTFLFFCHNF